MNQQIKNNKLEKLELESIPWKIDFVYGNHSKITIRAIEEVHLNFHNGRINCQNCWKWQN